jgi:hypothetical protein
VTALTPRKLKANSDEELAAAIAELHQREEAFVRANPLTREKRREFVDSWITQAKVIAREPAAIPALTSGGRNLTQSAILELVAWWALQSPDFVDFLRRQADEGLSEKEYDTKLREIVGPREELEAEVARRATAARKAELEAELAQLDGGVA